MHPWKWLGVVVGFDPVFAGMPWFNYNVVAMGRHCLMWLYLLFTQQCCYQVVV
jgi:hypothetical protein